MNTKRARLTSYPPSLDTLLQQHRADVKADIVKEYEFSYDDAKTVNQNYTTAMSNLIFMTEHSIKQTKNEIEDLKFVLHESENKLRVFPVLLEDEQLQAECYNAYLESSTNSSNNEEEGDEEEDDEEEDDEDEGDEGEEEEEDDEETESDNSDSKGLVFYGFKAVSGT